MRRADRLFEIIQQLRRRKLARAKDLAQALGVSERTIYRDIRDLVVNGVPIEGEAGIGYMLRRGYDLPPMMFAEPEIEALVLGARIVESWADPGLAAAARSLLAKVEAVIPRPLQDHLGATSLLAPKSHAAEPLGLDLSQVRFALRHRRLIRIDYRDAEGRDSERRLRPLALSFYGPVWLLIGWCELRQAFRCFRLDRVRRFTLLEEVFQPEPGRTIEDYLAAEEAVAAAS